VDAITKLRSEISWAEHYKSEWDTTPDLYVEEGILPWGKTRRLGIFKVAMIKAYLGVQHVDPMQRGWGSFDHAQARFFASFFVEGRCVALRTYPTMDAALGALSIFVREVRLRGS
jgi:hypothetical protein